MNHQGIVQLVKSMEVKPLTQETFKDFVQSAEGIFVPEGISIQKYFSPGYNSSSAKKYDFSKEKPEWRFAQDLTFTNIEKGEHYFVVNFKEPWIIQTGFSDKMEPMLFGFDSNKVLYLAEQENNGTPDQPWETLYVKLS